VEEFRGGLPWKILYLITPILDYVPVVLQEMVHFVARWKTRPFIEALSFLQLVHILGDSVDLIKSFLQFYGYFVTSGNNHS